MGKTYLMTVDLQVVEGSEWLFEEEEYPVYCLVDSEPLFSCEPVGEPAIVLHRFGGTYGVAKFLLTATREEITGNLQIILVNSWGVPFKHLQLSDLKVYEIPDPPPTQLTNFAVARSQPSRNIVENNASETEKDELAQEIREKLRPYILERCGTMRILAMSHPIELTGEDGIYADVNVLERVTGRRMLALADLLQESNSDNSDRFNLGNITQARISGLEAVERFDQLMVLGKPGSGKTTFLKYLALNCLAESSQYVPIFINLKEYAEMVSQPELLGYITQQFTRLGITHAPEKLAQLLNQGKCLILLDGLDEVLEANTRAVLQSIRTVSERYIGNKLVVTCRIAAREYLFERFTEVEIADFDHTQIAVFVRNWFRAKDNPDIANRMLNELDDNPPIKELATSPILLTLLSLVFEDANAFPANPAELYREGLNILLKRWDGQRNISRDQVYKSLSLQRKEDLLSQFAFITFNNEDYFFNKQDINHYIAGYFRQLSGIEPGSPDLLLDSEAVLKLIETQHGLLIERARDIYSFSHLTFHEYLAARQIAKSIESDDFDLPDLASKIFDRRWREVILLTIGMLSNASSLLKSIKTEIDTSLVEDEKLNQFLAWINQKSKSINIEYKPASIRAFYLAFSQNLEQYSESNLCLRLDSQLQADFEAVYNVAYGFFSRPDQQTREFIFLLFVNKFAGGQFNQAISKIYLPNKDYLPPDDEEAFWSYCSGSSPHDEYFNSSVLQVMPPSEYYIPKDHPSTSLRWQYLDDWWAINGEAWVEQVKSVITESRNFGQNWHFTESQKEKLQQYYDANKLLIACLNSDCYVSRELRREIEETLLRQPKRLIKKTQSEQIKQTQNTSISNSSDPRCPIKNPICGRFPSRSGRAVCPMNYPQCPYYIN